MTFKLEPSPRYEYGSKPHDFWPTPSWVTAVLLRDCPPPISVPIVEPAAGDGAIARVLIDAGYQVDAVEIREECRADLLACGCHAVYCEDWLDTKPLAGISIVMNPPFSLALQFVQSCVGAHRYVAALLPLNFLASAERAAFNNEHPVDRLLVLGKRPSFSGDGKTDSTNYAWFIWGVMPRPIKVVLP